MKLTKIKSIKKIDITNDQFDLEVDDNHNYFANNILVHNCRALAIIKKDGVQLLSRTSNEFSGLDHITKELAPLHEKYGDIVLDGELFNPQLSFQTITSLCKKSKNLSDESTQIQYWVYDMISEKDFHQRYLDWSNIIGGLTNVRPTPTHIIKSEAEIVSYHKQFTSQGYEGSMIRNLNSPYKMNGRSSDLLKYKDFDDCEFKVIGYKCGTGKFENVPTFEMVTKEGYRFEGVPVGTEEQRAQYLRDAKNYLGKWATVRFFGYTTTSEPVPRFPIIIELGRQLDNGNS